MFDPKNKRVVGAARKKSKRLTEKARVCLWWWHYVDNDLPLPSAAFTKENMQM